MRLRSRTTEGATKGDPSADDEENSDVPLINATFLFLYSSGEGRSSFNNGLAGSAIVSMLWIDCGVLLGWRNDGGDGEKLRKDKCK